MPPIDYRISLGSSITTSIASLATVVTTTVVLSTGAIVCLAISFLLCEFLKNLRDRLVGAKHDEVYCDEKTKGQDPEVFEALESFALLATLIGYAIYLLINLDNDALWVVVVSGSIWVTGVAIGSATTVAMLMGILKAFNYLTLEPSPPL